MNSEAKGTPNTTCSKEQGDAVTIDVTLVAHLLSLSPQQRIEAHEAARQLVRDLQAAGQELYARQSETSA